MSNIDAEVQDTGNSKIYANLDFSSGYWKLGLYNNSKALLVFSTTTHVVMPTRAPQGSYNRGGQFQGLIEHYFKLLRWSLKAWLEEILLHSASEEELLEKQRKFFSICGERGLTVSLKRLTSFSEKRIGVVTG